MGKGLFEQIGQVLAAREMLGLSLGEWIWVVILIFLAWMYKTIKSVISRVLTWMAKYWLQDELRVVEDRKASEEKKRELRELYEKDFGDGWVAAELILMSKYWEAETIYRRFRSLEGCEKKYRFAPDYAFSCVLARHGKFEEAQDLLQKTRFRESFASATQGNDDEDIYYQEFFVKPGGLAALNQESQRKRDMP